jgi:hypothetical protein
MHPFFADEETFLRDLRSRSSSRHHCWVCGAGKLLTANLVREDLRKLSVPSPACEYIINLCPACRHGYDTAFNAACDRRGIPGHDKRHASPWTPGTDPWEGYEEPSTADAKVATPVRPLPTPPLLAVQVEGIPAQLKDVSRWVAWRAKPREFKVEKVPVCCHNGRKAKVNDPAAWASFEPAWNYAREHHLDGIGFVFSAGDDLCGVDLDDCRDPATGDLKQSAWDVIRLLDSYTEVSPTGTGVKIFLRGTLPGQRRRAGNIEAYSEGRFFTVTGQHPPGTPQTVEPRQDELEYFYRKHLGGRTAGTKPKHDPVSPHGLSDHEIVGQAMRARNGDKFARLWAGDTRDYPSDSEADLALCRLLAFWVGPDPGRVEALFSQSAPGKREKWAGRPDYRARTVERAVEDQKEFFQPGTPAELMLTRGTRTNQIKQDNTGLQDTVTAPEGRREVTTEKGDEQGIQVAVELAEDKGDLPDWQAAFQLARRLRRLSADRPEQFEQAVAAFCRRAGREFEAFWYVFLHCWPKVRSAEGDDIFAWAAGKASEQPYTPSPCLGPMYKAVASIAWHLSEFTGGPFWLPRERLASLLRTTAMTVSRVVGLLERYGVLRCVEGSYSYTQGKAKEYVFSGPPLVESEAESAA